MDYYVVFIIRTLPTRNKTHKLLLILSFSIFLLFFYLLLALFYNMLSAL